MAAILIDNDIIAKCAIYSLINELVATLKASKAEIGLLGSIRFVLSPKKLQTANDGAMQAHARVQELIKDVMLLEPNAEETSLATKFEEVALRNDLQLDAGESQLCAIAITRTAKYLCTGDKRGILAIEYLRNLLAEITQLDQKVICFEALIAKMSDHFGCSHIRAKVCASKGTDKATEICFQCHNSNLDENEFLTGIHSYIKKIRTDAPHVAAAI